MKKNITILRIIPEIIYLLFAIVIMDLKYEATKK